MASGHVNRARRPNTWLHRPSCKREENPCQRGAVHTWHFCDIARHGNEGCFQSGSGHGRPRADWVLYQITASEPALGGCSGKWAAHSYQGCPPQGLNGYEMLRISAGRSFLIRSSVILNI